MSRLLPFLQQYLPGDSGQQLDRLVLLCLGLMVIVPFQHPHHFNPIASFFAEWWAVAFGLSACALAFLRPRVWQAFPLPSILLLPLLLILVLLVQIALGKIQFVEQPLLMAAILLWASLMACLGRELANRRGLAWLADGLAVALVLGALLEVLTMALQASHSGYGTHLIFPRRASLYGNLGQQNHLNHYLWLAIPSLLYLHVRAQVRLRVLVPALSLLILASALSTSRSILLYATAVTALAWLLSRHTPALSPLRKTTLLLLPLSIAFILLGREITPWLAAQGLQLDMMERFYSETLGSSVRLKLWRTAWHSILSAPWLGHGMGSVPWQYFHGAQFWPPGQAAPVAEHTHNLPLQWMLELGIPVAIVGLGLLLWWLVRAWRSPATPARWWAFSLLAVAAIHSLLEYPLWYTFFLGPFALLLGAEDKGKRVLANGRRGLVSMMLVLTLGGTILGILRTDYRDMERILNWHFLGEGEQDMPAAIQRLLALQANSLLAPQATVSFALMMEVTPDHLADRRALCRSAMGFAPTERVVFKCILLDALADDPDVEAALRRALAAFPEARPRLTQELQAMVKTQPQANRLLQYLATP